MHMTFSFIKKENVCSEKHFWWTLGTGATFAKNIIDVLNLCFFLLTSLCIREVISSYQITIPFCEYGKRSMTVSVDFRLRVVLHHQISASDVQYALSCFQVMFTTNQLILVQCIQHVLFFSSTYHIFFTQS